MLFHCYRCRVLYIALQLPREVSLTTSTGRQASWWPYQKFSCKGELEEKHREQSSLLKAQGPRPGKGRAEKHCSFSALPTCFKLEWGIGQASKWPRNKVWSCRSECSGSVIRYSAAEILKHRRKNRSCYKVLQYLKPSSLRGCCREKWSEKLMIKAVRRHKRISKRQIRALTYIYVVSKGKSHSGHKEGLYTWSGK